MYISIYLVIRFKISLQIEKINRTWNEQYGLHFSYIRLFLLANEPNILSRLLDFNNDFEGLVEVSTSYNNNNLIVSYDDI